MRVLVAGRNAKAVAQAAGAFANDLTMATATTKAAAFALLDHTEFDLVVACETLGDGSGLEVLSQVAVNTPNTLRIFAARPATLTLLKGELGFFGLFRTLPYPINFRNLWAAIELARSCCGDGAAPARAVTARPKPATAVKAATAAKAVTGPKTAAEAATGPKAAAPLIRHVVLEPDWDATQPLPVLDVNQVETASLGAARTNAVQTGAARTNTVPANATRPNMVRANAAPADRARATAARTAPPPARTSATQTNTRQLVATPQVPIRIPESENFKRALARRKGAIPRQEPSVTNESLAQLVQLSLKGKSTSHGRAIPAGRKRTAIFVGSGVFAAGAAAVLTFFMLGSNSSIGRPVLPTVASIDQPVPQNVLPWQQPESAPTADPMDPMTPAAVESDETVASPEAAADMQVQDEVHSEQFGVEPGHPGPPPPNPPPGPSEPPQYDASGMPVQE